MAHTTLATSFQVINLPGQAGITIRVLDWGGDGPPVVLLHPNGFCGGLYEPRAHLIASGSHLFALDPRDHGGSTALFHPTPADSRVSPSTSSRSSTTSTSRPWPESADLSAVALPSSWIASSPNADQATARRALLAARRRRPTITTRAETTSSQSRKEPLAQLPPKPSTPTSGGEAPSDLAGVRLV